MNAGVEHGAIQLERAVEAGRIRIDQQFGGVEALAPRGIEWAFRPQAIARAGADAGDMPMENVAGAAREFYARLFPVRLVEQGQVDRLGAAGRDGDVDSAVRQRNAEGLGPAGADAVELNRPGAQVITDGAARPVKCWIPAISFESAMRSPSAAAVSISCRAGSGSKRSI
jgi:hypothetical protein